MNADNILSFFIGTGIFTAKFFILILLFPMFLDLISWWIHFVINRILRFFGLRVRTYTLQSFTSNIFFLGYYIKQIFLISVANLIGVRVNNGFVFGNMNFHANFGRITKFRDSMILSFASFILLGIGVLIIFLGVQLSELLIFWGMNETVAILLPLYLCLSIFVTGRPTTNEVFAPLLFLVKTHSDFVIMSICIFISSALLLNVLGLYITSLLTIGQFAILVMSELRYARLREILEDPENNFSAYRKMLKVI